MQKPDMAMGIKGSRKEITCKSPTPPPQDIVSLARPSPLFRHAIHIVYFCATNRSTRLSFQDKSFVPMIDHIFGRPSPSWKRTQVSVQLDHRNSALRPILTKSPGIIRLDLLDMAACIRPRDAAQAVVAEEDKQDTWFAGGYLNCGTTNG